MALFGWLEKKHLDVPEEDERNGFLVFAQQGKRPSPRHLVADKPTELLKVNHYKVPRDKLDTYLLQGHLRSEIPRATFSFIGHGLASRLPGFILSVSGLLRHLHKEEGADAFLPILILVVLKANPEHLLSNVE